MFFLRLGELIDMKKLSLRNVMAKGHKRVSETVTGVFLMNKDNGN